MRIACSSRVREARVRVRARRRPAPCGEPAGRLRGRTRRRARAPPSASATCAPAPSGCGRASELCSRGRAGVDSLRLLPERRHAADRHIVRAREQQSQSQSVTRHCVVASDSNSFHCSICSVDSRTGCLRRSGGRDRRTSTSARSAAVAEPSRKVPRTGAGSARDGESSARAALRSCASRRRGGGARGRATGASGARAPEAQARRGAARASRRGPRAKRRCEPRLRLHHQARRVRSSSSKRGGTVKSAAAESLLRHSSDQYWPQVARQNQRVLYEYCERKTKPVSMSTSISARANSNERWNRRYVLLLRVRLAPECTSIAQNPVH